MHVRHAEAEEVWAADWPDTEDYSVGPPSIAWLTWHIGFWLSMCLNHNFGDASLSRAGVAWPGTAETVRAWLSDLQAQWIAKADSLDGDEIVKSSMWPFQDRPLTDVIAWVNSELMKNAAEIGLVRFLYAARAPE